LSNQYSKWRDDHVIFLDDGFDCDEAYDRLVYEGYTVERFRVHFTRDDGGREQGVGDPKVVKYCNRYGWLLLTLDSAMKDVHREHIAACTNLGIIATSHNSVVDVMEWVEGFIKLKRTIERNNFRKTSRPWYLQFSRQGRITVGPQAVTWPGAQSLTAQRSQRPQRSSAGR
jgi:hypothetical protein